MEAETRTRTAIQSRQARRRTAAHRLRFMRGLVTLATLLVILGAVGVWVRRVALDHPDIWSDTSGKIPRGRDSAADARDVPRGQGTANVDVAAQLRAALPPRPGAAPRAAPVCTSAGADHAAHPRPPRARRLTPARTGEANGNSDWLLDEGRPCARMAERSVCGRSSTVIGRVGLHRPSRGGCHVQQCCCAPTSASADRPLRTVADVIVIVVVIFALAGLDRAQSPAGDQSVRDDRGRPGPRFHPASLRQPDCSTRSWRSDSVRPAAHRIWWIATRAAGTRDSDDSLRGSDRPARRVDRRTGCPCHRAPVARSLTARARQVAAVGVSLVVLCSRLVSNAGNTQVGTTVIILTALRSRGLRSLPSPPRRVPGR